MPSYVLCIVWAFVCEILNNLKEIQFFQILADIMDILQFDLNFWNITILYIIPELKMQL